MNTPIYDFVKKYTEEKAIRLHMPGHKGKAFLGSEPLDITEVDGADVLYSASGVIKESMENAALLFSAAKTLYSTEGSSLSIRAMLYLVALFAKEKGITPTVLAGRNAHKAFISGAALNNISVEWLYPEESEGLLSCKVTAEKLINYLSESKEPPAALYVTSPDYLGNITNIEALSRVCKESGILLLVDNAHGAYLNFMPENLHPIALGADMCSDSAHKTLPVLTGGGYLHISKSAPRFLTENAEGAMSLFASTSPSYLIMQSLDSANKYLSEGYREKLDCFVKKAAFLKEKLAKKGFELCGNEALKITIATKSFGYYGFEIAEKLAQSNIVCEFADRDFLVLMLTPEISDYELQMLEAALLEIEKKPAIVEAAPMVQPLKKAMEIRNAVFSLQEEICVDKALGRILASYAVSCPPAVPVAICGEKIDRQAIEAFRYYGIDKIKVIK